MARQDDFEVGTEEQYFHGTVRSLRSVQPAAKHGRGATFPHDTDTGYAYATKNESDAWSYAEKAWHASGAGVPRVYRVVPKGPIERDPAVDAAGRPRSNYEDDVRSQHGFRVLNSVQMPESMGTPRDWR